jgi:hypothetical protein
MGKGAQFLLYSIGNKDKTYIAIAAHRHVPL